MKKIILIICSILLLTGCEDSKHKELIVGEWDMDKIDFFSRSHYSYYIFNSNNTFTLSYCIYSKNNSGCNEGEANWSGTYKIEDNLIILNVLKEKQIKKNLGYYLADPPKKLMVDFNKMLFCDSNDGIDCEVPYEKDTN